MNRAVPVRKVTRTYEVAIRYDMTKADDPLTIAEITRLLNGAARVRGGVGVGIREVTKGHAPR